jgi:glycosyltransferase involved in cell wall biosynthesis
VAAGVVVYRRKAGIDAIDQYSRHLVEHLGATGLAVSYVPDGVAAVRHAVPTPEWVLLQYNPFRYGRAGVAPRLLHDIGLLRRRCRAPLAVMVHEAWIDMTDPKSTAIGAWQRAQLRTLLTGADAVMTSTEKLADEIGGAALHVPIGANIRPVRSSRAAARAALALDGRLVLTMFGRDHPSRVLEHAEVAIAAVARARGSEGITVLNVGSDAPAIRVPPGVELRTTGTLDPDAVSLHMWAGDLALLPFTDGVSTKRSTLMAALAHGLAVLGECGANTDSILTSAVDALTLTPAGDAAAFARAAAELAAAPERLAQLGAAGRTLYETRFDWPVIAAQVRSVLEQTRSQRTRGVMFVGHHIGGSGGMERHTEQLIGRVLDAGRPVTVVARSCDLAPRPGLRFRRVPAPRRPFVLLYPTFFALASLVVARRREAVLHTTGALIANRADVSTVHYCHRAAVKRIDVSRAARPDLLYKLNQAAGGPMSRAGERWCYRPGRTLLLCAVSRGVAHELDTEFPAMAGRIRAIPNGVDAHVFRPDAAAREAVRAEIGLRAHDLLALFAGGDWERKGLRYAVGALAHAPPWHLAVAGEGDPAPLLASAGAAGIASRVHFLGSRHDMPRVYAAADAFVFPTAYEAFPLVALEAAASALPLLITRVNGAEELIEDGAGGWFIERDTADIGRRLQQLADDPELRRDLGDGARTSAERYSWQGMADDYMSIYAGLTTTD